jgi:hypothetical protein
MNPSRQFLALTPQRRALAFEQAATERAIDPHEYLKSCLRSIQKLVVGLNINALFI